MIKGSVDSKQVMINALIGGGTGSTAIRLGWANLGANTANNIYTSVKNNESIEETIGVNSFKILTGAFGMGIGHLYSNYFGGVLLPSFYGITTDNLLETK